VIEAINLAVLSTGKSSYWLSDTKKTPNLLDFGIIRGIPKGYFRAEFCLKLFSDYALVIFTVNSKIMTKGKFCSLYNGKQNSPISTSY
jgi:hypothetical protein